MKGETDTRFTDIFIYVKIPMAAASIFSHRVSSETSSCFRFLKGEKFSSIENENCTPWWDINESEVSYKGTRFTLK
jgi:hypothetical protein